MSPRDPSTLLRALCATLLASSLSTGCTGTTPDPARADPAALPRRELDARQRERLAALVDEAMGAVVTMRFDDAGRAATAAIEIEPRNARARAIRAMVLLQRASATAPPELFGANDGEHELQLARQLAPDDAFVGWLAAIFLAETGHMSAAAAAAEQALARAANAPAPERAALLGIAGTYRYELGEERAALPHLQAYVGLRPDDATARYRLGSSLLRVAAVPQGANAARDARLRAADAAGAFARCSELSPGDEDAALAVASAHWRAAELAHDEGNADAEQQHRRTCEQRLRATAERFAASAEPWLRLGVVAEQRTATDEAMVAYREALRRAPHAGAMLNLAGLLDAAGDRAAADTLLRQALEHDAVRPALTSGQRRALRERLAPPPSPSSEPAPPPPTAPPGNQAPRML